MANIIEFANNEYEERDKANDNIELLQQQAKRETKEFENELKTIVEQTDNNRKVFDILL